MIIIFIMSAAFVVYTYLGYPLILGVLNRNNLENNAASTTKNSANQYQELTVVIAMYNAEHRILARLENLITTKYPLEKLHIILVSDGSTDACVIKAKAFNYPRLNIIECDVNAGKASALNTALPLITTPLVVFADVRQNFDQNTLVQLATHFQCDQIGAVSGNLIIQQNEDVGAVCEPGLYWKYEKFIRLSESQIDSVVGVTGAIYMIRSKLLTKLPPDTILDDVYTPMCVVKKGYRVVMAEQAYAYDYSSQSVGEEFNRKVRTLAGNYQLMKLLPWINNPFNNPIFWQWFSHKVCRLFIPFALIALFISSLQIKGEFYTFAFIIQCCFYFLAYIGYWKISKGKSAGALNIAATFVMLNTAAFVAFFKYHLFSAKSLWKKH